MRISVDMNLSPIWTVELRADGHEAVHWRDVGSADAPDDEIMAVASERGLAVLTGDLGFAAAVVRERRANPVVIQLRCESIDPVLVGRYVRGIIEAALPSLRGGAVLTIDDNQARLRPGPHLNDSEDEI